MTVASVFLPLIFSISGASDQPNAPIVVTGNRQEEAEQAADQAKAITLRPPANKPLPRFYDPVCVNVFGLESDYAEVLSERIRDNLKRLKVDVGRKNCQPNSWVGFVKDSQDAVKILRKEDRPMFGDLHPYEIDRVMAGSQAAQAWHMREDKGIDGMPMRYIEIEVNGALRTVKANPQWQAGRITSPIRVDMIGAIVLFDRQLSAGRTVRQLADYATFRLIAPVKDLPSTEHKGHESILSLFSDGNQAASGMTEFDWAYLFAYYKLGGGAGASSIHDATKRAFLDGKGEKLSRSDAK